MMWKKCFSNFTEKINLRGKPVLKRLLKLYYRLVDTEVLILQIVVIVH